tara:strand:- start:4288 stop:5247 length:960 start_codon:yes stop_codon:yes gene_type:complete
MEIDRAVIEVNGGCNYTCQMCPQTTSEGKTGARGKNWTGIMPLDEFKGYVNQLVDKGLNVVNLDGSGEATTIRNLPEYIKVVTDAGVQSVIFSNGYRMHGNYMQECVDAGLGFFRFSIVGYSYETYRKWMNSKNFYRTISNLHEMKRYVVKSKSKCTVATYHLILDNNNIEYEVEEYKKIVTSANVQTEIWKMHNWSGVYEPDYDREGSRKTCGRPFSPDLVIRAGGLSGATGAVHPCCQVLGRDDEAVLGHGSKNSLEEIWYGDKYNQLRRDHELGNWPSYCEGCDFLIDDPEVLVYTNHGRENYKMYGTKFSLEDYR